MARTNGSIKGVGSKKRGRRVGGDKRGAKSARGAGGAQDGILTALVREIWSVAESGGSAALSGMAAVLLGDGKVAHEALKEVIAASETKEELCGAMGVMYGCGMVEAREGSESVVLDAACKLKEAFGDPTFAAMDAVEKLIGWCDDREGAWWAVGGLCPFCFEM
jgi:hypothetical protein